MTTDLGAPGADRSRQRYRWLTPSAPAAIAIVRCAAHAALIDRALPAPGAARSARLVSPDGAAVDELVVARVAADALDLMCHGGAGVRAAVDAALRAHGLVEDDALAASEAPSAPPGDRSADATRWAALAAAPSPAAARWLLRHGDAPPPFAAAFLRRPPRVLITGPANAGKSTLLNAWCGHARALVADLPGTTRDLVTADAPVGGWRVTLVDSAGLRPSTDPLERAGQRLALAARADADLVLFLDPVDIDREPGAAEPAGPQTGDVVVAARADRGPSRRAADLRWSARGADGLTADELLSRLQRLVGERLRLPLDDG